jgi:6-phosphogluconolactonase (cycloisomerase 2 family)
LVSTPSDEMGAANESERITCTGDQIAVFSVDKNTKKLISIAVVFTKGRCSGICLSDNAKFFYTAMQKRKLLAKFKGYRTFQT